ncbi:hypothetical protein FRC01_010685, partial [Tulasnella sp. 417]
MATPTYRIPAEVFEMIFKMTMQMTEGGRTVGSLRTLLGLMRVCRHWHTTILNCPRLWTYLDGGLPPHVARRVIERSRGLPILSLDWGTYDEDNSDEQKRATWWMITENSSRFKSMDLTIWGETEDAIWSVLESTTTALESLTIEVQCECTGEFTLSRGGPLKYLSLNDVSLNFNSQRLSGLVILRLYGSAVPRSLKKLIRLLGVAAAQLEELTIRDCNSRTDYRPSSSITLPRLKEIELKAISNSYSTALAATIYAPACSYIRIEESDPGPSEILDPTIWQPGNTQVAAFLGLHSGSEPRALQISIAVIFSTINIKVKEQ